MPFVGVQFDTNTMTLEITPERLTEIKVLLADWLGRFTCTTRELQQLVGKLNFVAACVRPARIFMARLYALLKGAAQRSSISLSDDFRKDLVWWATFLDKYNGVSMMMVEEWGAPDEVLATDACLVGAGGWCRGEYFHTEFSSDVICRAKHINGLELLTVIVACKVWRRKLRGKRLVVNCDNQVTVTVINSGRARAPFLQSCLRELAFVAATGEFEVRANFIPGIKNHLPDLLSRWGEPDKRAQFRELTQHIETREVYVYQGLFDFEHNW